MPRWFSGFLVVVITLLLAAVGSTAQLQVRTPVGAQQFFVPGTDTVLISWTGVADTTKVLIEASTNSGGVWKTLADSARGLEFRWGITNEPHSVRYVIRVSEVRPPTNADDIIYTGHGEAVTQASWSPDATKVVSAGGTLHIWDAGIGGSTPVHNLTKGSIYNTTAAWSNDGLRIAAANLENSVLVYDAGSTSIEREIQHPERVTHVRFDPLLSSTIFTACTDTRVRRSEQSGAFITHINSNSTIEDLQVSNNGSLILACADQVKVGQRQGTLPSTFARHSSGSLRAAIASDNHTIASVGGDATVRLWDGITLVEHWNGQIPREGVRSVCFHPTDTIIATGHSDSSVVLWNANTGAIVRRIGAHKEQVLHIAFSKDGNYLASGSEDNTVKIIETHTGRIVRSIQHNNDITSLGWSPDDTRLLTTSADRTARIWRIKNIIIQSDTSEMFTIGPPPPAALHIVSSGGTVEIGDTIAVKVSTQNLNFVAAARVDSMEVQLVYNATALYLLNTTVPVTATFDSLQFKRIILKAVHLDSVDQVISELYFRATLGTDTITSVQPTRIRFIGNGTAITATTEAFPIVITGACRAGGTTRLFSPIGTQLLLQVNQAVGSVRVVATLPDQGISLVSAYSSDGRTLWSHTTTMFERTSRKLEQYIPVSELGNGIVFFIIQTETGERASTAFVVGTE